MNAGSDDGSARRFDRQQRFVGIGHDGQARLSAAQVLVVGCGALGGSLAQQLVRIGVGRLVLVDRDVVEWTNLPRQVLFTEAHAGAGAPKALAAAESLAAIGGPTRIDARSAHVDGDNLDELARGADLVLDGTDNLATRYLLNDWCVKHSVPWIYAGVVGASGLVLPVLPGRGACLACLFPEPPPAEHLPTCDTAGVVLPAVQAVTALQAGLAMRWLASDDAGRAAFEPWLVEVDAWRAEQRRVRATRDPECRTCVRREFRHLELGGERAAVVLCGRNTVQIRPARRAERLDFERVLANVGNSAKALERRASFARFDVEGFRVTLFADGRALIEGTDDPGRARAVYDRWIGT
ncbi:MAG: ThiF family adenylyltransferase [Planctomycetes bacterium]|nr:ThiF family adenylyltransferase [Planctomycetota bacterium]